MLVLRKKIIFMHIKKSYKKFIIYTGLFYYFIKKKLALLISLSHCNLKKYNVITNYLSYFYTLKWNCASHFILNSKLNFLIEFFFNLKNIGSIKNLNYLSHCQYFVSVIRSPFVYKKSMEQFFFEKYKVYYQTNALTYNFFFHNYQYIYLKKILQKKKILKLFCKITFIFD